MTTPTSPLSISTSLHWIARPPLLLLIASLGLALMGCGSEEEEPPTTREICQAQNKAMVAEGQIATGDENALEAVTLEPPADGLFSGPTLTLRYARSGADDLLVRFRDNGDRDEMLSLLSRASQDGPAFIKVADASARRAGSMGLTNLDEYTCAVEDGTICAQLGLDKNGDGAITDDDEPVFNAAGGGLRVDEIKGGVLTVKLDFSLQLAGSVFEGDDDSTGSFDSCLNANYAQAGGDGWEIK